MQKYWLSLKTHFGLNCSLLSKQANHSLQGIYSRRVRLLPANAVAPGHPNARNASDRFLYTCRHSGSNPPASRVALDFQANSALVVSEGLS